MREIHVGEVFEAEMPHSEVCMHMRVAGKRMNAVVLQGAYLPVVQLLDEEFNAFSFPITTGEAGVYSQGGKLWLA